METKRKKKFLTFMKGKKEGKEEEEEALDLERKT